MTVQIFMRKRAAREGEIGLFVETEVFQEEWSSIKLGAEVESELSVPVHAKYRKFFHALCGKLADAVEWFNGDKDFAKEQLLLECRHATYHHDKLRDKTEIRAKTTTKLDADGWIRLLRRANYVCVSKFVPGMAEGDLKAEIEKMLGMGPLDLASPPAPEPKPKRQRAARTPKPDPEAPAQPPSSDERSPEATADGPSPNHDARPGDADKPLPPQNEPEYIQAATRWLAKQTDPTKHILAREYFDSDFQRELRATCRVSIGVRKMLERNIDEHFEKLKKDANASQTASTAEG